MSTAALRDAFNDVGGPGGVTCARAELSYENQSDIQWQVLTFRGTDASGQPFVVRSERLRPETDLMRVAREVATKLVVPQEPKP